MLFILHSSFFILFFAPLTVVPSVFSLLFSVPCCFCVIWFWQIFVILCCAAAFVFVVCWMFVLLGLWGAFIQDIPSYQGFCTISTPEFSNLLSTPGGRTYSGLCLGPEVGVGKKAAWGAYRPWLILPRNLRPPSPLVVLGAGRGPEAPRSLCCRLDNMRSQQLLMVCPVASFFGPVSTCFHFSGVS